MNIHTSIIFLVLLILSGCSSKSSQNHIIDDLNKLTPVVDQIPLSKPVVNVYMENSGSMDGYVKGVTEFEGAVYNYLADILNKFTDSLNLYYINSDIISQGSDIKDFIDKLEPATFRIRGGNRGATDISNILSAVLSETEENGVSLLITDGIFSPGRGVSADDYLVNQQVGIKRNFAAFLKDYPETACAVYQLSSKFEGRYYDREDAIINFCISP